MREEVLFVGFIIACERKKERKEEKRKKLKSNTTNTAADRGSRNPIYSLWTHDFREVVYEPHTYDETECWRQRGTRSRPSKDYLGKRTDSFFLNSVQPTFPGEKMKKKKMYFAFFRSNARWCDNAAAVLSFCTSRIIQYTFFAWRFSPSPRTLHTAVTGNPRRRGVFFFLRISTSSVRTDVRQAYTRNT